MRIGKLDLKSGRWLGQVETTAAGDHLELVQGGSDKLRLPLPEGWRTLSREAMAELARRPEVRLWCDDSGILWRVSLVGPGTAYPYPLRHRHLVFDSEESWAGIVAFDGPDELGDLTRLDLKRLRDRMCDFGGRRRGYRPPSIARSGLRGSHVSRNRHA
ncbi:MAG TPA: hypothetical protein VK929_10400 [Longimicrobiales bacterium]|nr:hypothetical protein [Longimicrobiales bacterium]